MDTATLKMFSEYNRNTNVKMNGLISKLDKDQWNRRFGGFFSSVRSLCNHIYVADFNWLRRFSKLRSFSTMDKSFFEQTMRFDVMYMDSVDNYIAAREEMDGYLTDFVNEIGADDLKKNLVYTDSHGKEFERLFGGLVLHMFNHQTHHRGMISIYLEEMGIQNDYSNMTDIL